MERLFCSPHPTSNALWVSPSSFSPLPPAGFPGIDLGPKPTCHSVCSSSLSFDFPQQGKSGAALKGLEDWLTALCLVMTPLLFSIMKSFRVPGDELDWDREFQWKLLEGNSGRIPWKFCRRKIQTCCDLGFLLTTPFSLL